MLFEIIERYPNKDIVLDLPSHLVFDWKFLKACEEKMQGNLFIRIHYIGEVGAIEKIKENNLKFFYSEPIKTFYELYALKKLGVSYVYIDAPLFF